MRATAARQNTEEKLKRSYELKQRSPMNELIATSNHFPFGENATENPDIKLHKYAQTEPILCIPRADVNTDKNLLYDVFTSLNLGKPFKIEYKPRTDNFGETYVSIYVHMYWFSNSKADEIRRRLFAASTEKTEEIQIVYNAPHYWKIVNSTWNHRGTRTPPSQSSQNPNVWKRGCPLP